MQMKSLLDQYKEAFSEDNDQYCAYCLEPQGEKIGCCHENHFVGFSDLYPEDQQYIIESEIEYAFEGAKQ